MTRRLATSFLVALALCPLVGAQSCADEGCTDCTWVFRQDWPYDRTTWKGEVDTSRDVGRAQVSGSEGARWKGFMDAYGIESRVSGWSYTGESKRYGPDMARKQMHREMRIVVQHVDTCDACEDTSGRVEALADTQFEVYGRIAHESDSQSVADVSQWVEILIPSKPATTSPSPGETDKNGTVVLECRVSGGFRLKAGGSVAFSREGSISGGLAPNPMGQWGPSATTGIGEEKEVRYNLGEKKELKMSFAPAEPGCEQIIEANYLACYLGCEIRRHAVRLNDPDYASGDSHIETTRHELRLELSCDDCPGAPQTFVFDESDRKKGETDK